SSRITGHSVSFPREGMGHRASSHSISGISDPTQRSMSRITHSPWSRGDLHGVGGLGSWGDGELGVRNPTYGVQRTKERGPGRDTGSSLAQRQDTDLSLAGIPSCSLALLGIV